VSSIRYDPTFQADIGALVAGAFLDFAERVYTPYEDDDATLSTIRHHAEETASAILRGDVQPAKAP
jgi:hypothetical protein